MTLSSGTKLGAFEITGLLGKGGMGEVYRARDTKLGRDVAVKVLREEVAADGEYLARFEREAVALAALNHPNIAGIHGFHEVDGIRFLEMELVEGETLSDRVGRSGIPMSEAVPIFAQIAEGLEAAHERNLIHRDLKPANIKITSRGIVKILDFGMAKETGGPSFEPVSQSAATKPVSPSPGSLTTPGMILGTPNYMSPEQARGMAVDKRTDIWAFGCCLYQALTGEIPFQGSTVVDILGGVLNKEPEWGKVPRDTPPAMIALLKHCLEKDPRYRLRDIGDAWSELKRMTTDSGRFLGDAEDVKSRRTSRPSAVVVAVLIALMIGAGASWFFRPRAVPESGLGTKAAPDTSAKLVKRFAIDLGPTQGNWGAPQIAADIAVSPDGSMIAYAANVDGTQRLYLRRIDALESIPIAGTERAASPAFSPDNKWISFQTYATAEQRGSLKRVLVEGGVVEQICPAWPETGNTWLDSRTIVFTTQDAGDGNPPRLEGRPGWEEESGPYEALFRVSSDGGTPTRESRLDVDGGELAHFRPEVLPGGRAVLFTMRLQDPSRSQVDILKRKHAIALYDTQTKEHRVLIDNAHNGKFAGSGHIVFVREGSIWAVPFDLETLTIVGDTALIEPNVASITFPTANSPFAFSDDGAAVILPAVAIEEDRRVLVWVDRGGVEQDIAIPPQAFGTPRVSPDGARVALERSGTEAGHIWIHEFARPGSLIRLATEDSTNGSPVWSSDSRSIIFTSVRNGIPSIFSRRVDGVGSAVQLVETERPRVPSAISPDGSELIYSERNPGTGWDVGRHALTGDQETATIIQTDYTEGTVVFSPDGKWIAYASNESGNGEVYVRPYPNVDETRYQVTYDGGIEPLWSVDGNEIFFRALDKMMSVKVHTENGFRTETPRELFSGEYYATPIGTRQYDLEYPEGERFLMIKRAHPPRTTKLIYIENWFEELKRLAPGPEKL